MTSHDITLHNSLSGLWSDSVYGRHANNVCQCDVVTSVVLLDLMTPVVCTLTIHHITVPSTTCIHNESAW